MDNEKPRATWKKLGLAGIVAGVIGGVFYLNYDSDGLQKRPTLLQKLLMKNIEKSKNNNNSLILLKVLSTETYDFYEWEEKLKQNPEYKEFFAKDPNHYGMELILERDLQKTWNKYPVYIINTKRQDTNTNLSFRVIETSFYRIEKIKSKIKPGTEIAIQTGNCDMLGPPYGKMDVDQTDFSKKTIGARISSWMLIIDNENRWRVDRNRF